MMPDHFWALTPAESRAWIDARISREADLLRTQAWLNGIAFRAGYVAARNAQYQYPDRDTMFPTQNNEPSPEESEFAWRAHRTDLIQALSRGR